MPDIECKYRIKKKYDSLSTKEKKIADYILENTEEAVSLNIEKLAQQASTSLSTVVRFVRHLGYDSFQHFRISLVRENIIHENRIFEVPISKNADSVSLVFDSAIKTLEQTNLLLNRDDLDEVAELLTKARRICLFGLGGSNIVAYNTYHKFIRLGLNCIYSADFHMQLINASQMTEDDVALVFSHTGVDIDTIAIKDEAKKRGAKIVSFNSALNTPISEDCDIVIAVSPHQETYISESFSARIAYLTVIDVLYVSIIKKLEKSGEKNLEKMRDVMSKRSI